MGLVTEAENFITNTFEEQISPDFEYHDLQHTREVVHYSKMLGEEENLSDEEMETLLIAAWFHDSGFSRSTHEHEKHGAQILQEQYAGKLSAERLEMAVKAILSTKLPQRPNDQISRILCDADMFHLSLEDEFIIRSIKLRNEQKKVNSSAQDERSFWVQTEYFLSLHEYFTPYGKNVLQPKKEFNKHQIEQQIAQLDSKQQKKVKDLKKALKKLQEKTDKLQTPSKGIETMFRLTARNQINLSSIADNKANILISVNSIIVSIIVTMLVRKFSEYPNIIVPSLIFLLTSLITLIFAILSTRPNITKGRFDIKDVKAKKVNLLFFGNFFRMSLDEYDDAIKEIMKDYNGLYSNMIMDQYFLGKVLGKKYRLLRIAYTIFMFGFTISVLSFAIFALLVPIP